MNLVGQQVGAYRILALLGRGGTAEVYKAYHPALDRQVAIKLLLREASTDEDWVRRFHQEALLLGKLDHPHILPIYDAGEHEGRPYLVMKYVGGGVTLRSQLTGQPWPMNRVLKVVSQVADALHAAHDAGIVHRDVKPSNILVTADFRCLVFDFGIAKPFKRDHTATGEGLIVGTPEFMSPEQCKGEKVDHRSDLYALGIMVYQMLTGHVPFSAETPVGILMKHLTEPLPIPPKNTMLLPSVNEVLRKALARDPEERYTTTKEFSAALQESVQETPTVTLRAARLPLPYSWRRHLEGVNLPRLGALAAVWLALGALAGILPADRVESPHPSPSIYGPEIPAEYLLVREKSSGGAPQEPEPARSPNRKAVPSAPERGYLMVDTDLPASVSLDGKRIGRAPGLFSSLPSGRHRVQVTAGDGKVHEEEVLITARSTSYVRTAFEPTRSDEGLERSSSTTPRWARLAADPPLDPTMLRRLVFTGYLTDDDCRERGGLEGANHLRCAERCIRLGRKPMLYRQDRLYKIDGFEHVTLRRGEPLTVVGWLDEESDTIHVSAEP